MSTLPDLTLSVVAPCFNEEEGLPAFHARVSAACRVAFGEGLDWEIVLVNDGSRDSTFEVMRELAGLDDHVVVVNLGRNYGHQIALTAGLFQCRGQRILIIDADLQDPPELLHPMMQLMDETGADVVYGQRRKRAGETRFKSLTATIFYRLLRRLVDVDIPLDTGDFRLMTRRVLEVLNSMPEQHRFIRGMVAWIGYKQLPLLYDREARTAGVTNYPLLKMIRLAIDAVTSFSIVPLRVASYFGALIGVCGFLGLSYTVLSWAFGSVVRGWTSVASLVLILGGVQLLVLGVLGEYLGRLFLEIKRRPLFVIDQIIANNLEPRPRTTRQVPASSLRS